uniref:T9SS type A sorting domain-containing protein n=1 Tax=Mariniflexile sp. TaxID=1979402 RepID=UPI004047E4CB
NIQVRKRKTVILTEQVYKSIKVDDKGILIVDTPVLYINKLETDENVTIEFNQPCIVLIDDEMKIGEKNTIDRNGFNVIFYVEDDVTIKEKSIVDANIYSKDDIEVKKSSRRDHTKMTGLFIALDEIKSKEYVDWYKLNECPIFNVPNSPILCDRNLEIPTDTINEDKFEIKTWPNPFKVNVSLKLLSQNSTLPVKIHVYDLNNRLVHYEEGKADQEFNFGRALESGLYIVKVIQGNNYKQIRLIKSK